MFIYRIGRICQGSVGFAEMFIEYCSQITGYPQVATGIRTVGCKTDFKYVIYFRVYNLRSRRARTGVLGQHYDSAVIGSQSELIFRADHAFRYFTANFGFSDYERFPVG